MSRFRSVAARSVLRIAWRNVRKSHRRTVLTVIAIGLSFGAINVFGGFTHYVGAGLADGYVYGQARGHLTIVRHGYLQTRQTQGHGPLIDEASQMTVREMVEALPEVAMVTRELHVAGIVEGEGQGRLYYALGRVASDVSRIGHLGGGERRVAGLRAEALSDDRPEAVAMSSALAGLINVGTGESVRLIAQTVAGVQTRRDVELVALVPVPMPPLDTELMLISLDLAQDLLGTSAVDRFTVLLHSGRDARAVQRSLQTELNTRDMDMDVWSFLDLDPFTTRTTRMFETIFSIVALIIFAVATLSVMNTTTMAVMERTREIGTLRALGLNRRGILRIFAVEGGLLALLGSTFGVVLTCTSWGAFKVWQPTWSPPYLDLAVPLEINLVPTYLLATTAFMVVLAVLSVLRPAWQAARQPIAVSLRSA